MHAGPAAYPENKEERREGCFPQAGEIPGDEVAQEQASRMHI